MNYYVVDATHPSPRAVIKSSSLEKAERLATKRFGKAVILIGEDLYRMERQASFYQAQRAARRLQKELRNRRNDRNVQQTTEEILMSAKHRKTRLVRATKSPGDPVNPFERGHGKHPLYKTLFEVGSKKFMPKDELVRQVAKITGKSQQKVIWALQVMASPRTKTNKGRTSVETNDANEIKIVDIRRVKPARKTETPSVGIVTTPATPVVETPAEPVVSEPKAETVA